MLTDLSSIAGATDVQSVDPLSDPLWDQRLQHCPHATFYHSSAWARVLCDTYGYTPHYLAVGPVDAPTAVLPIMEINSRLTGRRGVSLPFTDDCEAAGSDPLAFVRLFERAQAIGKARRWRHLELRGGLGQLPAAVPSLGYFGHRVPLHRDEAITFGQFHSSVRRAIRKAERSSLKVELSTSLEAVADFYNLFCKTRKRHGLPPQPFSFHTNIHRHVLSVGLGKVVIARLDREPVAGAIFFHGPGTALMKFAASDLRFQHLRINNLVLWEAMRHYGQEGLHTVDFGRTSLWNEGLLAFKRRWGPVERKVEYCRYDYGKAAFGRSPDATGGWQVRIFQHMPIPLSRLAGRLLYRHMA